MIQGAGFIIYGFTGGYIFGGKLDLLEDSAFSELFTGARYPYCVQFCSDAAGCNPRCFTLLTAFVDTFLSCLASRLPIVGSHGIVTRGVFAKSLRISLYGLHNLSTPHSEIRRDHIWKHLQSINLVHAIYFTERSLLVIFK